MIVPSASWPLRAWAPHAVTGGVAEALICTAGGITVAVLALIPYNYFVARAEGITEQIEHYATRNEAALQATAAAQVAS